MPFTVGPVWRDGEHHEDELIASCYRNCFALAEAHGINTIAFPAISTGAFGFPLDRATGITLEEAVDFLKRNNSVEKIIFVCFGKAASNAYHATLSKHGAAS